LIFLKTISYLERYNNIIAHQLELPHYLAPAKRSCDYLIPNCVSRLDHRFLLENNLLRSLFDLHPKNITSRLGPSMIPRAETANDLQLTR